MELAAFYLHGTGFYEATEITEMFKEIPMTVKEISMARFEADKKKIRQESKEETQDVVIRACFKDRFTVETTARLVGISVEEVQKRLLKMGLTA